MSRLIMLAAIQRLIQQRLTKTTATDSQADVVALATAALLIEISRADAEISAIEQEHIQHIIEQQFALPTDDACLLIKQASAEVEDAVSLYDFTRLLNEQLPQRDKIRVIRQLWEIAYADKQLDKYEEYYIRKIADLLYISHTDYIKAKHQAAPA